MKISERERKQPLTKKSKRKQARPREKSPFRKACDEAGQDPSTIRNRMRKDPTLTLEEALRKRPMTREEVGRSGASKSDWPGRSI